VTPSLVNVSVLLAGLASSVPIVSFFLLKLRWSVIAHTQLCKQPLFRFTCVTWISGEGS